MQTGDEFWRKVFSSIIFSYVMQLLLIILNKHVDFMWTVTSCVATRNASLKWARVDQKASLSEAHPWASRKTLFPHAAGSFYAHCNFYTALQDAPLVHSVQTKVGSVVWKVWTAGAALRNPVRSLPKQPPNTSLIHFTQHTVSRLFGLKVGEHLINSGLFFNWTRRTGFVRTICHCIDITAALLP